MIGEGLPEPGVSILVLAVLIISLVLVELHEARKVQRWARVAKEDSLPTSIPTKYAVFLKLYELEDNVTRARMELRSKMDERRRIHGANVGAYRRLIEEEAKLRAKLHLEALALERFLSRSGLNAWQERIEIPRIWMDTWTS